MRAVAIKPTGLICEPGLPLVYDEDNTLMQAHCGMSIARFGDGELKLALGRDAKSQEATPHLRARLCTILKADGKGPCLVCLPITTDRSPKAKLWNEYRADRYLALYNPETIYGSAFITRPDTAPWIDTPEYWDDVAALWRGREVVLVRGSTKSLTAGDLVDCDVEEIVAPRQGAFAGACDGLFRRLRHEKRRVILCLGATATVLAFYLAQEGVHALDLGHIGMAMRRVGRLGERSE